MSKALVPGALVSILAATSASAAPAVSPLAQLKTVMPAVTLQVQDHERRDHERRDHERRDHERRDHERRDHERRGQDHERREGRDHNYTVGEHYDRAPSHYRSHADRPHDWHSRGCIRVGEAWFCP